MTEHPNDRASEQAPEHADLPLPDYDHLPAGSIHHRIRSLDADQLQQLRDYEQGHAHRVAVLQELDHRLQALRDGATPSGGDQSVQPEHAPAAAAAPTVTDRSATSAPQPPRPAVDDHEPNQAR